MLSWYPDPWTYRWHQPSLAIEKAISPSYPCPPIYLLYIKGSQSSTPTLPLEYWNGIAPPGALAPLQSTKVIDPWLIPLCSPRPWAPMRGGCWSTDTFALQRRSITAYQALTSVSKALAYPHKRRHGICEQSNAGALAVSKDSPGLAFPRLSLLRGWSPGSCKPSRTFPTWISLAYPLVTVGHRSHSKC